MPSWSGLAGYMGVDGMVSKTLPVGVAIMKWWWSVSGNPLVMISILLLDLSKDADRSDCDSRNELLAKRSESIGTRQLGGASQTPVGAPG